MHRLTVRRSGCTTSECALLRCSTTHDSGSLTYVATQVHDLLSDDGVFYFQVAGLRRQWQWEDLVWGLFMGEHVSVSCINAASTQTVGAHLV